MSHLENEDSSENAEIPLLKSNNLTEILDNLSESSDSRNSNQSTEISDNIIRKPDDMQEISVKVRV